METGRIKTAVEFLKDGQSFNVGDLRLEIERNTITVTGWSQYSNIENLNKNQALKELDEIKTLFKRMIDTSPELRTFIVDKKIEYNLYFDDYGKGSITICSEKDGALKWKMEFK
jgi:hypothetical protein